MKDDEMVGEMRRRWLECWNDGWLSYWVKKTLKLSGCLRFSIIPQYSSTPLLHRSVKARGDWSKKDIAILTPYYT
jgi:hypothetical protein